MGGYFLRIRGVWYNVGMTTTTKTEATMAWTKTSRTTWTRGTTAMVRVMMPGYVELVRAENDSVNGHNPRAFRTFGSAAEAMAWDAAHPAHRNVRRSRRS